MSKIRDPFFDVVKALAMFLVLLGHVNGLAAGGVFPSWCDNFRVGMNMPIFFVISGYFAWPTIEGGDWGKVTRSIRSYFQPALFAGVVFVIFELALGITSISVRALAVRMLRFVFVDPWFVTTLAGCYLLLFVSFAIGRKYKLGWVMAFAVWLLVVCRPSGLPGTKSFGSFVSMFPHFVFGAIVLRRFGWRPWEVWKYGVTCFVTFLVFVIFEGNVGTNGMSFYTADSTVQAFASLRTAITFVLRPLVGVIGAIGVMWFVRVALILVPQLSIVSKIGTLTLGIYVFHLWPLERMREISWISASRWSIVLTAMAMLMFFSVVTWLLMEKVGRFKKWIWGRA